MIINQFFKLKSIFCFFCKNEKLDNTIDNIFVFHIKIDFCCFCKIKMKN